MLKNKMFRWRKIILAAAAAIVLVLLLKPKYDRYIYLENAETCFDAMYWTGIWYHEALREAETAGIAEDRIDYEKVLREVVSSHYSVELDEDLSTDRLCRGGGHVQMILNPDTHRLEITCDADGHIWYNDEAVDDDFLDRLEGAESGIDLSKCMTDDRSE